MTKFLFTLLIALFSCTIQAQSDTLIIKNHLTKITRHEGFRNYKNLKVLNEVAAYIYDEFKKYADTVYYQEYQVDGITYKNVVCNFGPKTSQ
ncbi:hypothetical protein [Flavobacterium sp. 3HN19-14]|uniref:hypothetical protein n=1 Tax=Flavobacterium sp. 3HN19-14 TaxID=3448133 RepID=UPI003EE2C0DE